MIVEVLKPVDAGNGPLQIGEVVDASAWRLVRQLIAQRYVRPVLAEQPEPKRARTKEKTNE